MRSAALTGAALAALLSGCDSSGSPVAGQGAPTHGIVTSSAATAASAHVIPYADATLPDEADFAAEAEREITADNYLAELTALEQELADGGAPPAASAPSARPRGSSSAPDPD